MEPMRTDNPMGRLKRTQDELGRYIAEQRSSNRALGATTISKGDLTVDGGGNVQVRDGGGVNVRDGGNVVVEGGGGVAVADGGRLYSEYPSGQRALQFGPVYFTENGPPGAHGLLIEAEDGSDIFRAAQMADGTIQSMLAGGGLALSTRNEDLQIFGLPTSTQPGNLRLVVGEDGAPRIFYGTNSNEENKPDLASLTIAAEDVLRIEPQQWAEGDDLVVGATVEQVKTIESVAPYLLRPRYGGGENLEHDRIAVLQQVVLRDHEARIAALESENAALRDRLDALEQRLTDQTEQGD